MAMAVGISIVVQSLHFNCSAKLPQSRRKKKRGEKEQMRKEGKRGAGKEKGREKEVIEGGHLAPRGQSYDRYIKDKIRFQGSSRDKSKPGGKKLPPQGCQSLRCLGTVSVGVASILL